MKLEYQVLDKKNGCWLSEVDLIAVGIDSDGKLINEVKHEHLPTDDYEVNVFTGLVDIHGRKIYEGDTVLIKYARVAYNTGGMTDHYELMGIVEFSQGAFVVHGTTTQTDVTGDYYNEVRLTLYEILNADWFKDPSIEVK